VDFDSDGNTVELYDVDNYLINTYHIPRQPNGPHSIYELHMTEEANVALIVINLAASGAVAKLSGQSSQNIVHFDTMVTELLASIGVE